MKRIVLAAFGTAEPSIVFAAPPLRSPPSPPAPDIVGSVKTSSRAVLLAPLMLTAGEHALRDMAGDCADSCFGRFRAAGFAVECHPEGLGSNPSWADIYVEHIKEL